MIVGNYSMKLTSQRAFLRCILRRSGCGAVLPLLRHENPRSSPLLLVCGNRDLRRAVPLDQSLPSSEAPSRSMSQPHFKWFRFELFECMLQQMLQQTAVWLHGEYGTGLLEKSITLDWIAVRSGQMATAMLVPLVIAVAMLDELVGK